MFGERKARHDDEHELLENHQTITDMNTQLYRLRFYGFEHLEKFLLVSFSVPTTCTVQQVKISRGTVPNLCDVHQALARVLAVRDIHLHSLTSSEGIPARNAGPWIVL